MNSKVVYIHRKATNGEVFYVGIGNPKRPYEKGRSDRSEFWCRTVDKYGYNIEVIRTGLSWEDACDIEQDLIELIGRRDLGLGTLVNLTDGGDGAVGLVYTEERKAEVSKRMKEWMNDEFKELLSEVHSRAVVDTSTGIEYKGMGVACDELGFKVSTITDQLRGKSRVQPYNTLRYLDDVECVECEMYEEPKKPFNEIQLKNVIDIATNKIYDSMRVACEDMGISYNSVRNQLSGSRKRKDYNTLYKLSELTISPEGYETKEDAIKSSKKGAKKPVKKSTFPYMERYIERQKNKPKKVVNTLKRPMKRIAEEPIKEIEIDESIHKEVDDMIAELIAYRRKSA